MSGLVCIFILVHTGAKNVLENKQKKVNGTLVEI